MNRQLPPYSSRSAVTKATAKNDAYVRGTRASSSSVLNRSLKVEL